MQAPCMPRGLATSSLRFRLCGLQILNLLSWLAPNAYLVSVPCRWNGTNWIVVVAFAVIRWTLW